MKLWLKKKKKKKTKKELRGIEEEDKIFEEQCSDTKTIFDRLEGIELGIEKALKIGPIDWEESNQAMSFGLKTAFFRLVEKQVRSIKTWKIRKFWKLGIFYKNTF